LAKFQLKKNCCDQCNTHADAPKHHGALLGKKEREEASKKKLIGIREGPGGKKGRNRTL